jgi:hypothetical protein
MGFLICSDGSGYHHVNLSMEEGSNRLKIFEIHRLVAENFLIKNPRKDYVNHKDLNKLNNFFKNLEWVTPQENTLHYLENK